MKKRTFSTGFMIAILMCLLLLSVGWAQQPKPGGTLRVAWEADVSGLDPHLSFGMQARLVVGNLFNSLVTIDPELNVVPDLAESWEVLENSKVYVFHLRKGVKFHDGTDFDAEVVRWNYQRVVDPNAINHADSHVDALIDRMRAAATEEEYLQAGYDFQRYVVENMLSTSVSSYGHLQAARTYVQGYENLHGYKLRFETTWLDK
jgi:ABC-type transport system substrate-binding protein